MDDADRLAARLDALAAALLVSGASPEASSRLLAAAAAAAFDAVTLGLLLEAPAPQPVAAPVALESKRRETVVRLAA
jgi:hypothetical protein